MASSEFVIRTEEFLSRIEEVHNRLITTKTNVYDEAADTLSMIAYEITLSRSSPNTLKPVNITPVEIFTANKMVSTLRAQAAVLRSHPENTVGVRTSLKDLVTGVRYDPTFGEPSGICFHPTRP